MQFHTSLNLVSKKLGYPENGWVALFLSTILCGVTQCDTSLQRKLRCHMAETNVIYEALAHTSISKEKLSASIPDTWTGATFSRAGIRFVVLGFCWYYFNQSPYHDTIPLAPNHARKGLEGTLSTGTSSSFIIVIVIIMKITTTPMVTITKLQR